MERSTSATPLDYRDYSGRFLREKFRRDLLDTYGSKAAAIRKLKCDKRTVYRWFDPDYPYDPNGRRLDRFCRHRSMKLRIDRWLPRPPG